MSDPEPYDLHPEPQAPPAPPAAQPVPYASISEREIDAWDFTDGRPVKNLYLPIVLTLVGCAAVLGRMLYFKMFARDELEQAWRWTGFMLIWNIGVLLVGVLLIAKMTGMGFGPLPTAIIKLAAIAVAPHAVTMVVEILLGGEWFGTALGWLAGIPFAWWLFMYLFDLDMQEALICVGVTTALRWMSYLIYWLAL